MTLTEQLKSAREAATEASKSARTASYDVALHLHQARAHNANTRRLAQQARQMAKIARGGAR